MVLTALLRYFTHTRILLQWEQIRTNQDSSAKTPSEFKTVLNVHFVYKVSRRTKRLTGATLMIYAQRSFVYLNIIGPRCSPDQLWRCLLEKIISLFWSMTASDRSMKVAESPSALSSRTRYDLITESLAVTGRSVMKVYCQNESENWAK